VVCVQVPAFPLLHGLSGRFVAICPTAIISGLLSSVGFDVLSCAGATGDYHTDLLSKANSAVAALTKLNDDESALDDSSLCFIHVKAVDDCGHDRNVEGKIHWLQQVDLMVDSCISQLQQFTYQHPHMHFILVLTGDHSTPVLYGDHSCEPVPILIADIQRIGNYPLDEQHSEFSQLLALDRRVQRFDEISCSKGVLGRFSADGLIQLLSRVRQLVQTHYGDYYLPVINIVAHG